MTQAKKSKKKAKSTKELPNSHVKLRFRKHFLPPLAGLLVFALVFGFFNSGPISTRIAYYLYSRHNVVVQSDVVTAAKPIDKNAPSTIIINKIGVSAPIVMDQNVVDETAFQVALENGVVHYPNTAEPGQKGNVVIFGHSSSQWWSKGQYKYIFTVLDQVVINDTIFIEYQGARYVYRVNNVSIVDPTDTSVLNQNDAYTLTLITCSPVGTNSKRLIVRAVQILPEKDYSVDSTAPVTVPEHAQGHTLPGSMPSFWQDFKNLFKK
jgi:LPXTG-site transpeptidase (sortase) family protein